MQASGNHKVEDEPDVTVESEGDAFADAFEVLDGAAFDAGERRLDGAEKERIPEAHTFEGLSDDSRGERVDVSEDIRKLRHSFRIVDGFALRMTD
jgi:hypothetical protein